MKKYFLPLVFIVLGGMLAFNSCQYDWIEFEEIEIPDTLVISFSNDVVPIFERGCNSASCHGGNAPPDLRPDKAYTSLMTGGYVNLDEPGLSSIYTAMIPGGSMASYTMQGEPEIVLKWIEQGALDNK